MKQNSLIQSSGIICCIVSVILFMGWPLYAPHKASEWYCYVQALLLNYCFISIHAHFSFVMWHNLTLAMGWKFMGIKDPSALVGLMFFISISIPIVPTIIITAYNLGEDNEIILIDYFFCVVNKPAWLGYRFWFILFSFPGIVAAGILFYKTMESRRKMLRFKSKSQFSKFQLARMFFSLIVYLIAAILSVALGFTAPKDGDVIHFSDFMPACVGFLLFIAYGLGSTAIEFYKKIYINLGASLGVDNNSTRSSFSSRRSSLVSSPTGRKTSIVSNTETRNRRPSQLSESFDETFIYDLPEVKTKESDNKLQGVKNVTKRSQVRRGSEPVNRIPNSNNLNLNSKTPIEMIPEVNEHETETEDEEKEVTNEIINK